MVATTRSTIRAAPRCAATKMVALATATALMITALAATSVLPADAKTCVFVPVHRVLSSAKGVFKLSDGRQLQATVVDVGGCTTMASLPSGVAYRDSNGNYTVMSHENDTNCVTGTGRDGSTPSYTGFQAVVVEANGFKFSADMVLEDIDSQADVGPTDGWRETMSSLGMADGAVVRPTITTKPGSLVAVRKFRLPARSLQQVGFPASDLLIDGAAYDSWTESTNCPFRNDPTGQCKAFVSYRQPIDRLLIIYAITQKGANDANAAAFLSEINLACGCQCGEKKAAPTAVTPVDGSPGTCQTVANHLPSYGCDFLGKQWCEAEQTTKWVMTDAGSGACKPIESTISRPVSLYMPSDEFSRLPAL
ncbi:hypothetical protein MMPV_006401 [Pyropia vietnamensis]